jgi:hypothetical protein
MNDVLLNAIKLHYENLGYSFHVHRHFFNDKLNIILLKDGKDWNIEFNLTDFFGFTQVDTVFHIYDKIQLSLNKINKYNRNLPAWF